MIYDRIENLERYCSAGDAMHTAVTYAASFDLAQPDGEYEVNGRDLFAKVQAYDPAPAGQRAFEAHRSYYDVQIVREGLERHDVSLAADLEPLDEYDAQNDVIMLTAPQQYASTIMEPGMFAVYFPQDAHRPNCRLGDSSAAVRKICMKVRL